MHCSSIDVRRSRYPEGEVWVSPMFAYHRPDMPNFTDLSDSFSPDWRQEIDFKLFAGSVIPDEVVFLHKRSRTVILNDSL